MKKALIVTLYGDFNYGNKFQNYAMQKALEKCGLEVRTATSSKLYTWRKENVFEKITSSLKGRVHRMKNAKRISNFKAFSDKYLKLCTYGNFEKINKEFDMVCLGSDQIWNPNYMEDFNFAYGEFSDKVFSYAASFGIENIESKYIEGVKKGLNNVKHISVREQRGAEIVKELTEKEAEVVVDPTLLLNADEWDEIAEAPENAPKKKYIFLYFLGKYSEKRRAWIEAFANKNDMEVVCLGKADEEKYWKEGPSQFLYLLKNSELVVTDSFHGSVFSIIYKRPFFVMDREDNEVCMNSRLVTLLGKFGLEDRKVNKDLKELSLECNYDKVDEILESERKKSKEFLEKAISELSK